ncbi:uncharacterized protein LOC124200961 [Daphnia pulex]|uniref:uncharacterized protein LOC124200961 n=1 Tax=Daphnia pulex TaxID=6669 RepID=UPI001EDD02C3|nr:uncharacterized protein LOC124200961 [Daphnia pulex]
MNSDINWLTLVVGVILIARMDLVATGPVCSDDYWPCTCKVVNTSAGVNRLQIHCDQIRYVGIVKAVFERTPSADVHSFYMTIPETSGSMLEYLFQRSIVRNIYLTCQTDSTIFKINTYSFTSLKNYLESFHIDNCDLRDLSESEWNTFSNFHFLKSLTFSRTKKFNKDNLKYFPRQWSLTTLNITHSYNFETLFSHYAVHEKFPRLVNLVMNYCPNVTTSAEYLEMSLYLLRIGFEIVEMNGNQFSDVDAENILKQFSYRSEETLRSFSLRENRLTQLPNIDKFPALAHLRLDNNNFTNENFSLAQLNGSRLQTLTLSSCNLKNIKPHALEVDGDHFQLKLLDLDNNNLTKFKYSVFKNILRKMADRWEDPGVIHVHRNAFDCDCHLAWLIVDNRHLLRHVRGARCSDGLAFTKLWPSQFAACNGTSGQLKPRSKHP